MGIYYHPPMPHMGRQQPTENRKLPPALALVDTPPFGTFLRRADTRQTALVVVPAWAPDLSRPFVGGFQPLDNKNLNPVLDLVDTPPFGIASRRGDTRAVYLVVHPSWQPDLSRPFVGGFQPLGGKWLNPALEKVPDPPFAHVMRQDDSIEFWTIRQAWDLPPPLPWRPTYLAQPFIAVTADNPPPGWPPDWFTQIILGAWRPPDPLPQRQYPTQILSVDNPPFAHPMLQQGSPEARIIRWAWEPPDPLPQQRPRTQQILSVDNPPFGTRTNQARLYSIVGLWQPGQPLPSHPFYVVPIAPAQSDNPPFHGTNPIFGIVRAWEPTDVGGRRLGPGFGLIQEGTSVVVLGPMEAGTVPVRYLVGVIPNVVPVVTVLTNEAGVVPVREFVGPDNVVPVREVTTEDPHVKVRKV